SGDNLLSVRYNIKVYRYYREVITNITMPYSSVLLRTFNSLKIVNSRLNLLLRRQIKQLTWNQKNNEFIKGRKQIFIIDCKDKWEQISTIICRDITAVNAVGFDCEWVHTNCKRKPVALAQLATYSGQCILVRLNYLQSDLPSTLLITLPQV
ncbi:hypothetical protein Anas_11623, partial [Armadillidium nasatum]